MIIRNGKTTHLIGKSVSYIMHESETGELLHFYFGRRIADRDYSLLTGEWHETLGSGANEFSLEPYPQEYPAYGYTDMRSPAYQIVNRYGNTISRMRVKEYIVHKDCAVQTEGMPCLFKGENNADTLEVVMYDDAIDMEIRLYYIVFEEYDIIARHAVIVNRSSDAAKLYSAYSANLELPMGGYDMIYYTGAWAQEMNMQRTRIEPGMRYEAENARGISGHQMNPFVMIASHDAAEASGEVYGLSLIYSGNHSTVAKTDQLGQLRVQQGINPMQFAWTMMPGESFTTPQSVLCFSSDGFGGISREYHKLYRNNLMRSRWTHRERPILINNWEGTYFDFNEEKLLKIAEKAKEAGIELFVLDDGWFGRRDSDNSSLGDWVPDERKLPNGIKGLAEKINALGMKFGLWFEPEMVSPDSELYRAHPDWAVHVPQRRGVTARWQYLLDLSRDEVCEYVIEAVSDILRTANVEYVKWDMNRGMSDMPYPGYAHEYVLGYYRIMDAITSAFPEVLFEGCCSGGGRFDPGVLAYMPQIWASDNSDAVARMKIQYSTSMCYPVSCISTHVTASPNHQNGRLTTLKTRADVAYAGTFGYELDITHATDEEMDEIKKQIAIRKQIDRLVHEGELYRLASPFEGEYCTWELVSQDKSRAFVFTCKLLSVASSRAPRIKLMGLDPDRQYMDKLSGRVYEGDLLMRRGLRVSYAQEDFATEILLLKAI